MFIRVHVYYGNQKLNNKYLYTRNNYFRFYLGYLILIAVGHKVCRKSTDTLTKSHEQVFKA